MILDEFLSEIKTSKKILITGHTGFKGTWLTLLLQRLGYEVCGIGLEPEKDSLYQSLNRKGNLEEEFLDIRDREKLRKSINVMKPSIVFHLAAQALVLKSYNEPVETFETNVLGTVNVLDSCFKSQETEAISVITTDKVYANNDSGKHFIESDPLYGKDPYSASKVATEAVVAAWQQLRETSSGPCIMSFRAGNVIGGGDQAEDRLLPDLVRGFISGNLVEIRSGSSTRPWQHVLDPLAGYLLGTARNVAGQEIKALNLSPEGESLSVTKVSELACQTWGSNTKVKINTDDSGREALTLQLDSSLARKKLGWRPAWTQEEAVVATVKWWRNVHKNGISPIEACNIDLEYLLK